MRTEGCPWSLQVLDRDLSVIFLAQKYIFYVPQAYLSHFALLLISKYSKGREGHWKGWALKLIERDIGMSVTQNLKQAYQCKKKAARPAQTVL